MPYTLLSRILPQEISLIIYDYVKLNKVQEIYWYKLYSPAHLIIKKYIAIYSKYDKIYQYNKVNNNELEIVIKITNTLKKKGFIKKNIYIFMDEYIDNLMVLKKHLDYHFKYIKNYSKCINDL
jgi:hypothetical protein